VRGELQIEVNTKIVEMQKQILQSQQAANLEQYMSDANKAVVMQQLKQSMAALEIGPNAIPHDILVECSKMMAANLAMPANFYKSPN